MDARTWQRLTAPIFRHLRQIVTRGVVRLVDPAQLLQELQIEALAGEVLDHVEHFEPHGFTSNPLAGAEVLLFSLGGGRSHNVAGIVTDRRYRPKGLAPGEVALYTDEDQNGGHRIHFKRGNEIHLIAGASSIVMKPTGITITTPALDIVKV